MAIVEISMVPIGTGSPSVSRHVARVIKMLQSESEIKHTTTAMGTIVEGDLDKVLAVIRKMHESAFNEEVVRVVTTIKIDDRRDKPLSMNGKLGSLREKLEQ